MTGFAERLARRAAGIDDAEAPHAADPPGVPPPAVATLPGAWSPAAPASPLGPPRAVDHPWREHGDLNASASPPARHGATPRREADEDAGSGARDPADSGASSWDLGHPAVRPDPGPPSDTAPSPGPRERHTPSARLPSTEPEPNVPERGAKPPEPPGPEPTGPERTGPEPTGAAQPAASRSAPAPGPEEPRHRPATAVPITAPGAAAADASPPGPAEAQLAGPPTTHRRLPESALAVAPRMPPAPAPPPSVPSPSGPVLEAPDEAEAAEVPGATSVDVEIGTIDVVIDRLAAVEGAPRAPRRTGFAEYAGWRAYTWGT